MTAGGEERRERQRSLRERLDALNRKLAAASRPAVTTAADLAPPRPPAAPAPIVYQRDRPRLERPAPAPRAPVAVRLEAALAGVEVVTPDRGPAYVVTTPTAALPDAQDISRRFARHLADPGSDMCRALAAGGVAPDALAAGFTPADILFLDIETTGLGNTPAFLVGLLLWTPTGLAVEQYLARHYAEEAAMLALFLERLPRHRLLVTFNGRTFDAPYLQTRALALGVPWSLPLPHFDLLPASRRIWRGVLPNCRLQTLEAAVCGRPRFADIPGSEIPDAYHDFVRTGNAWRLAAIVRHNQLDLLTMADLWSRFPALPP